MPARGRSHWLHCMRGKGSAVSGMKLSGGTAAKARGPAAKPAAKAAQALAARKPATPAKSAKLSTEMVATTSAAKAQVIARPPAAKPAAAKAEVKPAIPERAQKPGSVRPGAEPAPPPAPEPVSAPPAMRRPPGPDRPSPRPPAKAENFAEGDHVVYPTHVPVAHELERRSARSIDQLSCFQMKLQLRFCPARFEALDQVR